MRTLKGLGFPHNQNYTKFKDGSIQNETDTEPGTPVVEQVYGDLLTNIYKLLELTGIDANQSQDSEDTGFQIVQALQKLSNLNNDIEHILNLNIDVWEVPIDIDALPDKFVFIARASETYIEGQNYFFKGASNISYPLSSPTGFNASDEILVIIDKATVRVYSLQLAQQEKNEIFPIYGTPLSYNQSDTMYYQSNGNLVTDTPNIYYLQQAIRVAQGNGQLFIYDMMVVKGYLLCFVFDASTITYNFYQFALTDFSVPVPVNITGVTFPIGTDNKPYLYSDGSFLFMTNESGTTIDDHIIHKLDYDPATTGISYVQTIPLANSFLKTTNTAIKNDSLITFVNGSLKKYLLSTGAETDLGLYNTISGVIFNRENEIYFTTGGIAKKWELTL